mgnify:CR=1 FL=1
MPQYLKVCFILINILLEIQNKTHSANIFKCESCTQHDLGNYELYRGISYIPQK